jgi:hypothetical protein|tara:strand:- start:6 stop:452 length:447 start_codon:yes stop_codon:yes gene_type:complete
MSKNLTDKQELFCTYYVSNGGRGSIAAKEAGYSENSCREQSYELLRKPHIQDRIRQLMEQHFGTIAPDMASVLKNLALNARSELVRYNSAKDLLDRAGFKGMEKVLNLSDGSALDESDLRERIDDLLGQLFGGSGVDTPLTPQAKSTT